MKVANEEILSSNEELQSTNEELETAKEELQSSNEELITLNNELQHHNTELAVLTHDLNNLLVGVDIPVLVLDAELRVRRFTPVAGALLNLIPADVGRPFNNIASNLDVSNWQELFSEVVGQGHLIEREVKDRNGHRYSLRMRPYKNGDNQIEGVLLVMLDTDAIYRARDEAQKSGDYARAVVETVHEALVVVDSEWRMLTANRSFCDLFRVSFPNIEGEPFFGIGGVQWDAPRLRERLQEVLSKGAQFEDFELNQDFPEIGRRNLLLNARRIDTTQRILIAIGDVTERKRAQESVQAHAQEVQSLAVSLMTAQEEERRRVSRELHDQICQQLASLAIDIGGLVADPPPAGDVKRRLKDFQARAVKASEETRHIAYQLHPSVLDDLGLTASLRALCNEFSEQNPDVALEFANGRVPRPVPREIASCLYRVAQASLQNTAKHAGAEHVSVALGVEKETLVLTVVDDGVGFDPQAVKGHGGLGLIGMEERARSVNGKLTIDARPGHGTRIAVQVPLPASSV
jgi:two-component system CheB/CheR fusion protein